MTDPASTTQKLVLWLDAGGTHQLNVKPPILKMEPSNLSESIPDRSVPNLMCALLGRQGNVKHKTLKAQICVSNQGPYNLYVNFIFETFADLR